MKIDSKLRNYEINSMKVRGNCTPLETDTGLCWCAVVSNKSLD